MLSLEKKSPGSRRSKWANRLLLVALVTVLVVGAYSLADLGLRQLRFNNCMRQLKFLEMRRVQVSEPLRPEMHRTSEGLDDWADLEYRSIWYDCKACRRDIDRWPR